ncbi:hypothetical protein NLX83_31585 [Allokutzneria sp. A3M-2-11 16]|uniref:hypothetical protein n=1 Tax=Allokutzneria sp. A3M-2-11 16 TaxID=2962043 RepID=UPI0020B6DD8D|nr:hypothetical protein [Allokutzneria sp. A3M-2-11 16]MCP3803823.1 hypothetical protein [Allokutzneria sp. A3M-2-11 16]
MKHVIVAGVAVLGALVAPGAAGAAPVPAAQLTIESYCGGTGVINDQSRQMAFHMIFTGSGPGSRTYNAHYLSGQFFKTTHNPC